MKNRNPSTVSYREMLEFLQSRKPPQKPPQKSHLREYRVIVGDSRADFTIRAKTISSAYSKSVRRLGLGHTIVIDGGNKVLTGRTELE